MSGIDAPLLVAKEQQLNFSNSILKKLPELLDFKQKSLLSDCTVASDSPSTSNLDYESQSLVLTTTGVITSILSHSDGSLTYGKDSGEVSKVNADLKLIKNYEPSSGIPITILMQSPDENTLVALFNTNYLTVYRDGEKFKLEGHNSQVTKVDLTNICIATCDLDLIVNIWDSKNLNVLSKYEIHKMKILSLKFFRHSNTLLTSSSDQKIRLIHSDEEVKVLSGHTGEIQTAITSLDDKLVFSGGNDNTVRIWSTSDMEMVCVLKGHQDNVTQLQIINSDLFVSAGDLTLIIWSSVRKALVGILRGHTCSPTSIIVKDNFIYSASSETSIRVWKIETCKEVAEIEGHSKAITSLAYLQGSIFSASEDSTLRRNQISTTGLIATLGKHKEWVLAIAISSDNQHVLTGGGDKLIFVWEQFKLKNKLEGHSNWISRLEFIKNDSQFISCSFDRTIKIWDFFSKTCIFTKTGHEAAVYCMVVGDMNFITGSFDKSLKIWNFDADSECITCKGHEGMVLGVSLAKKRQEIISVSRDKTIRIWNASSGKQIDVINLEDYSICVDISESEEIFITGSYDKIIRVWDYKLREIINILEGHSEKIDSVRLLFNDRFLITGSSDTTIKVWSLSDLNCIATYNAHNDRVRDLKISKDLRFAISSSTDHKVKIWKLFTPIKGLTFQCVNNQWEGLYAFKKSKTPEKWMKHIYIEPYNINLLHVYAYHNKYKLLAAALEEEFPFITSSDNENPLSIAIKRSASLSINEILLHFLRISQTKPRIFANFVKVIEKDLIELCRFQTPTICKFLDELVVIDEHLPRIGSAIKCLPFVKNSESFNINPKKFLKDETETHDLIFEKTLAKIDVLSGSYGSVKLVHNLLFNPLFDGQNPKLIRMLSDYKGKRIYTYIVLSSFLTIANAILCFWFLNQLWPIILALNIIFLTTEIIEIAQDRLLYFKYFDNLLELIRCLWTGIILILIAIDDHNIDAENSVILLNVLKCFGLAKFIGCMRICYFRALHTIKALIYSNTLAILVTLTLEYFFNLEYISTHLFISIAIIGFFIFEGHLPASHRYINTRELLRIINRNEKLKICCRRGQKIRYLHSLNLFDPKFE